MRLRWLHLSDFHTGRDKYGQSSLCSELLKHVSTRLAAGLEPDLVFLSGDIANHGKASEYEQFQREFLGPLRALFTDSLTTRVFVAPGNHDVDRDRAQATVAYTHPEHFEAYFDPTDQGLELRRPSFPRFADYHDWLRAAGLSTQAFDTQRSFYTMQYQRAILIRHRAIAEEIVTLARSEFGESDVEYHKDLALAAARLRDAEYVAGFNDFVYVGRTLREKLHRPDDALTVAEALVRQHRANRYYLAELAVSFGSLQPPLHALNACVAGVSVADIPGHEPPTNDNAKVALAELGFALGALFEASQERVFVVSQFAVAALGLTLDLDRRTEGYFLRYRNDALARGATDASPAHLLADMAAGVQAAWHRRERELPASVRPPDQLSYSGLARLLDHSTDH
jgi:hypothetical protein